MNISAYLSASYQYPPCWCLVVDVLRNERGLVVENYQSETDSTLSIARAFRYQLSRGAHGFVRVDNPRDYDVVLMSKPSYHVGIFYGGKVLHASKHGAQYQEMFTLKDQYRKIEFYRHGND